MVKKKKATVLGIVLVVVTSIVIGFTIFNNMDNGKIYLYGEEHGNQDYINKELEIWEKHYKEDGMRDLFIELSYGGGEFLNLWMQEDDDTILNELYADWEGTLGHDEDWYNYFKQIKERTPETVFHGTDIAHQYETTDARYLEYLESVGEKDSEKYKITLENIEQAKRYLDENSDTGISEIRESSMTENFIREFEALGNKDVMGIYGGFHTEPNQAEELGDFETMYVRLEKVYGDRLESVYIGDLIGD